MVSIYDSDNYEPCSSVAHLVNRVRTELVGALDRELAVASHDGSIRVTAAQLIVLGQLAAAECKKSASDLCKEMSYDPGGMTRVIDRLESKGLLRRVRCPLDRRLVYLEMTEQGREVYPRLREISMVVQSRFLRGFSRVDKRQFRRLLGRLLENVA